MKGTTTQDPTDDLLIISRKGLYGLAQSLLIALKAYCSDITVTADDEINSQAQDIECEGLISANEVIKKLKISYPTLWRYGRPNMEGSQYYLPSKKINGRLMYKVSDVDRVFAIRIGRV